jgi:hypothetical protein
MLICFLIGFESYILENRPILFVQMPIKPSLKIGIGTDLKTLVYRVQLSFKSEIGGA